MGRFRPMDTLPLGWNAQETEHPLKPQDERGRQIPPFDCQERVWLLC